MGWVGCCDDGGPPVVGRDDERVERALLRVLEPGPRDILGVLDGLRTRLGAPFQRCEAIVHVVLQRASRAGRIEVCGPAAAGLPRYRIAESGPNESSAVEVQDPGPVDAAHARVALRMARALRNPADRGRLQADVIAHLSELGAEGRARFGSAKSMASLLRRVDRGKPTVVAAWNAGDFFRRVLMHDGPWILGVIAVFFLVRGFVVEVFTIPTESMLPTLQVDDRVAVWKLSGAPKRYQIMTFDRGGTTYVKRLMGLAGEEIALWNGDVFINRKRLVKPDDVREAMRFPLSRWDFRVTEGRAGPGTDWRRSVSHDEVTWFWNTAPLYPLFRKPSEAMSYGFRLRDAYLTVSGDAGSGSLLAVLTREAYGGEGAGAQGRVVLDVGGEGISLTAFGRSADGSTLGPKELAHDPRPRSGRMTIEIAYVDAELHAHVGDWQVRIPFELPDEPITFEVGTRGRVGAGIETVKVDADLHYAQDAPGAILAVAPPGQTRVENFGHQIPADHVFFLGDNTTNSNDSRTTEMGDIPRSDLIGPVVVRVWPFTRIGLVD